MNLPLLCAAVAVAALLPAQQFELLRKAHVDTLFEPISEHGMLADVDGNGSTDILLRGGSLLVNDGRLGFTWHPPGTRVPTQQGLRLPLYLAGDVDGDGDLDLISARSPWATGQVEILVLPGNPGGSWGNPQVAARVPILHQPVALEDLDRDGLPDLMVIGNGTYLLLRNVGGSSFVDVTATSLPAVRSGWPQSFADADGDGDLDFVTCNGGPLQLQLNDGTGRFATAPMVAMPALTGLRGAQFGDLDADGDPDLFVLPARYGQSPQVLVNDGSGRYQVAAVQLPSSSDGLLFRDLDRDGDADALIVGDVLGSKTLQAWVNTGGSSFSPQSLMGVDEGTLLGKPALADLDGDGDLDVVLGGNLIYLDVGGMRYEPIWRNPVPWRRGAATAVAGDIDGDGDVDLFAGADLLRNDGCGWFAVDSRTLPDPDGVVRAVLDADGDGDLDVVWNRGTAIADGLLLNQSGFLVTAPSFPAGLLRGEVVVADFDRDRQPDLCSQGGILVQNRGGGVFAAVAGPQLAGTGPVVAGDFDGDGLDDVLFGDGALWHNRGGMQFQPGGITGMQCDVDIAAADLDRDGDLDIIGLHGIDTAVTLEVWSNLGAGSFARTQRLTIQGRRPQALAIGDIDADGAADVAACAADRAVRLWHNDGAGNLVEVTATRIGSQGSGVEARTLLFADVDGDGDQDIVALGLNRAAILANRHRHLGTPRVPVLGQPYRIEMAVQPGYGPANALVIPLLAFAVGNPTPLPGLGTLHLPQSLVLAGPLGLTAANGVAIFSMQVPTTPALYGIAVYWQGLVAEPAGIRLTGFVRDRILR